MERANEGADSHIGNCGMQRSKTKRCALQRRVMSLKLETPNVSGPGGDGGWETQHEFKWLLSTLSTAAVSSSRSEQIHVPAARCCEMFNLIRNKRLG